MTVTEEDPGHRPLVGGAVMGAVSRVSVAVTGALTTVVLARLLGPDGAGSFAIAQTVMLVLTVMGTFGVEHGIAFHVAGRAWPAPRALRTAWRVAASVGVLGAALGVGARLAAPSAFGDLTVVETALACAALPFALAWFYASFIAVAVDDYEGFVLPPAVQSAAMLVLVVAGALAFGLAGAVAGLAASHVLTAVAAAVLVRRSVPAAHGRDPADRAHLRRAVSFGIKGYAANALQIVNTRADLFILSAVTATEVVGHYAVALGVTTVLWLLPQALSDVLFPRIAALQHRAEGDAQEALAFVEAKSMRHAVIVVAVSTLALAAAILTLVVPVYGAAFRPAIELGLLLLPGVALLGLANIMSATIVGRGKPIYSLYTALIVTPVTLVLYAVLIPRLEGEGAALAKTASYVLTFLLALVFYRRVTGRRTLPLFVPTRSELADLRALPGAVRARVGGRAS